MGSFVQTPYCNQNLDNLMDLSLIENKKNSVFLQVYGF